MVAPHRILVVDDEPMVTRGCRRTLTEAGYEVDTVATGREGLRRAVEGRFDAVMTDLRLPDLSGMDIVRTVRRERPDVAVIVITGFGSVPSAVEAAKLGVTDYIEKPFTPDQITEAVERALAAKGEAPPRIEADQVREVLTLAVRDPRFSARLLGEGSRVLSGHALGPEARAAIVSGDIAWIEKTCGDLGPEERRWLQHRLEAEVW